MPRVVCTVNPAVGILLFKSYIIFPISGNAFVDKPLFYVASPTFHVLGQTSSFYSFCEEESYLSDGCFFFFRRSSKTHLQ